MESIKTQQEELKKGGMSLRKKVCENCRARHPTQMSTKHNALRS
jgi:hypothetical protein